MKDYNLHLKGYVGDPDFDSDYVDYTLQKNKDNPVAVLIDSLGGRVATALSIASAFKRHGDVSVHFVGMNASAATIASLGAKHISIDSSAMYLVHKCSSSFFKWCSMNADEFDELIRDCSKVKADLDKLDVNIAEMYAGKCKKKSAELLDLMKEGKWLTAKEALAWGFVDEVTDLADEPAPQLTEALAAAMAAAGMPVPPMPAAGQTASIVSKIINALSMFFTTSKMNTEPKNETPEQQQADPRVAELEAQLAAMTQERDTLRGEVEALKKAPGATTNSVIDNGKKTEEPEDEADELADFVATSARAAELLKSIR